MARSDLALFALRATRPFGEAVAAELGVPLAGVVSGEAFGGDVEGRTALVIDDLIASGGTMTRTAKACLERGAEAVWAAAAHGLFVGDASRGLADPALAGTVVTDTVPPFRLEAAVAAEHLEVISAAPLFADAVRRMHQGRSPVGPTPP